MYNRNVSCRCLSYYCICCIIYFLLKASDALQFKAKETAGQRKWLQTYKLLTKRAPLFPEIAVEFACLPMVVASFQGMMMIYAPIPGSKAKNTSRDLYNAFLAENAKVASLLQEKCSFIDLLRTYKVETTYPNGAEEPPEYKMKKRSGATVGEGVGKERCALGIRFPFAMLDIFIGAWCAMMVPHRRQEEFMIGGRDIDDEGKIVFKWDDRIPKGAKFTTAA